MAAPSVGTPEEWTAIITRFIRDHVARAGADGVVVGVSGGLDSAVVASLAVQALGAERVLGLLLPGPGSDPQDAAHGELVCTTLGIRWRRHDVGPVVQGLGESLGRPLSDHVHGNAKARARMMLLYAEAQSSGRLVCGTGNKSELLVGYFTKHGDGGVDLQPLGDLYKSQVAVLAAHLDVPQAIRDKPPSAGLRPGQTDEEDLGMSYARLDAILKGVELNAEPDRIAARTGESLADVERVVAMVRQSEHKRHAPLVPKVGARTVGVDWRRPVHWG